MRRLAAVLICFFLLALPKAAFAIDWFMFFDNENVKYYCDRDTLTQTWDGKIRVHEQIIFKTAEEVIKFQKDCNFYEPVSHVVMAMEYDYIAETVQIREIQGFYKNELVFFTKKPLDAHKIAMASPAHMALRLYLKLLRPVLNGDC